MAARRGPQALPDALPCVHGKRRQAIAAGNPSTNRTKLTGKTIMKTSTLVAAIAACALAAPIVSAQDKSVPAKPAMSMDMMQMMMAQMLQHDQIMESMPAR